MRMTSSTPTAAASQVSAAGTSRRAPSGGAGITVSSSRAHPLRTPERTTDSLAQNPPAPAPTVQAAQITNPPLQAATVPTSGNGRRRAPSAAVRITGTTAATGMITSRS